MPPVTIRQCVIFAGALDTRLDAPGETLPGPLKFRGGRPFLATLLREFCRFGVTEFLLLTVPGSDAMEHALPALRATLPRPVTISAIREPVGAGTGGALFDARDRLHERFLLCNGDALPGANLAILLAAAAADGPEVIGRMLLRTSPDASRSGVVTLEGDRILTIRQRRQRGEPGIVNAGVSVFRHDLVNAARPIGSLEDAVLPALAAAGTLRGTLADAALHGGRALFLDRDGVVNVDHGHVGSRERFEWMPGALEAIRHATETGWHVFVVTNQSGVARGLYDEAAVCDLLHWMADEARRHGGTIDDVRHCPFHADATVAAFRAVSDWRKPAPGMLLDLIRAWELDPARCVLIGDQATDLEAAAAAGVRGFLFGGGNLLTFVRPIVDSAP
jgi:D-glycero-D-manno-heptose 1,7-bisphosphate phosphatase